MTLELKDSIEKIDLRILRETTGLSRKDFADFFGIPLRTVEDWEAGRRKMPDYLLRLMVYKIKIENWQKDNPIAEKEDAETGNVNIICDAEGNKIVLINDIRFKGRQKIDWKEIEKYLKEYVGKFYEIAETLLIMMKSILKMQSTDGIDMIPDLQFRFMMRQEILPDIMCLQLEC